MSSQFDLLVTRRFLPLFITQFLGAFNDNTFKNALVILITYRISQAAGLNAQVLVTLAAGIFILPFFLFSATAGQLADKYEKSRLIGIIKFAEILLMLLAAAGFYTQSVTLLMGVLFLLGMQATFFGPVKYAILPNQLREDELIAGNGLIEAGTFLSILLGTILGGVLILLPGGEVFISATVCLLAVVGFIVSLYIPNTQVRNLSLKVSYNFIAETFRVIQYSKERWDIYLAILGISWFWLVGAVFLAEFPVFTRDTLHANENVVTYLIALFSIGIAIGSMLCNRLLKGKVHATYVPLGALGITIFTIDLYFAANHASHLYHAQLITPWQFLQTTNGWHISFDLLLTAICGGIYTVPLYAMLQARSEPSHRARVIASNNVMNALFMVIAAVATLIMLNLGFSVNQVFLIVAILNGVVAIYSCRLWPEVLVRAMLLWLFKTLYNVS
jgi:acyl-[acyl-carrier-protein]-phospholipid O-acyltransferase/long-chain-fatty-acid--[acyl-carrier-protein] ligase